MKRGRLLQTDNDPENSSKPTKEAQAKWFSVVSWPEHDWKSADRPEQTGWTRKTSILICPTVVKERGPRRMCGADFQLYLLRGPYVPLWWTGVFSEACRLQTSTSQYRHVQRHTLMLGDTTGSVFVPWNTHSYQNSVNVNIIFMLTLLHRCS